MGRLATLPPPLEAAVLQAVLTLAEAWEIRDEILLHPGPESELPARLDPLCQRLFLMHLEIDGPLQ